MLAMLSWVILGNVMHTIREILNIFLFHQKTARLTYNDRVIYCTQLIYNIDCPRFFFASSLTALGSPGLAGKFPESFLGFPRPGSPQELIWREVKRSHRFRRQLTETYSWELAREFPWIPRDCRKVFGGVWPYSIAYRGFLAIGLGGGGLGGLSAPGLAVPWNSQGE